MLNCKIKEIILTELLSSHPHRFLIFQVNIRQDSI